MFTLGWFRREFRMSVDAWKSLGNIPGKLGDLIPQGDFTKSQLGAMRLNDWHCVLRCLMSDVKQLQKQNGLHWVLFGQQVMLQIPIMFIIGDIEGHDKLCSRKAGHNKFMREVTRSCKVKREECGDPHIRCEYLSESEVFD